MRADPPPRFDVWTADDGLPQNIIRGIQQGDDGYLWIATLDGLARFDGVRFTVFDKSNSPGILSNRFSCFYQSQKGEFWLCTEGSGVTRYHEGRFTTYTTHDGLPHNDISGITGDGAGHIWLRCGSSIVEWHPETVRFVDVTPHNYQVSYNSTWEDGGFWGVNGETLYGFAKGRSLVYALPKWLPGASVWGAAEDRNGTIWIETLGGRQAIIANGQFVLRKSNASDAPPTAVYRNKHGDTWTFVVGPHLSRLFTASFAGHLQTIEFQSAFEDRDGNLWIGADLHGLCRLSKQFINVYSREQGLIGNNVYPIYQDRDGAIWIGAWPSGLSRYLDGKFTDIPIHAPWNSKLATALFKDGEGTLWMGTHGGLWAYRNGQWRRPSAPQIPAEAIVQAINQDAQGALWFGTSRGLVRLQNGLSKLFTTADGLAADEIRVLVSGPSDLRSPHSQSDDMWIGSDGGLTRYRDGQFTHWTEHDGLPGSTVRCIYIDNAGVVWIGTYDSGLGRFQNGRFTRYTVKDGLFSNGVFQILEDASGSFWMSCNRGIYRVSKQELNAFAAGTRSHITSAAYGRSDGMLTVECNGGFWPAGIKAQDGRLWFPTEEGVAVIDPNAVPLNPRPPSVVIESFLLDHVPTNFSRPVKIPPDKQDFEIGYTALSFVNPHQIRFRYMLEGLDDHWMEAGVRRSAYYSHVPPGKYVFRVIAANSDDVWNNEGKSLSLTVQGPFYRAWWFQLLVALSLATVIWIAWRYRISQLEHTQALQRAFSQQLIASQERERQRIAAELHDSLGQRLIVIKNLALFSLRGQSKESRDGAGSMMEEIDQEASAAIEETRTISYNLRPFQLDRLGLTKAIQGVIRSVAGASGLQIAAEIDNIDDVFPEDLRINFYRIIQESLNNIMKHANATEAKVEIRREANRLKVTIQDNGSGFVAGEQAFKPGEGGFGLTGMVERTQSLGGKLTVHSTPGRGAALTIDFHLNQETNA